MQLNCQELPATGETMSNDSHQWKPENSYIVGCLIIRARVADTTNCVMRRFTTVRKCRLPRVEHATVLNLLTIIRQAINMPSCNNNGAHHIPINS